MAKTLDQTSREPQQQYRTKQEEQRAFRPRYDPQQSRTPDASRDVESLMASKSSMSKQEHAISSGMAKRMASDHIAGLNEEINFINSNMNDVESRDTAILKLQASIASTAGVSQGLSGDAAMAYDEMYIGTARKLTSDAITQWKGQQDTIDKNTLKTEFQTFMNNTYSDLDPDSQQIHLAAWGERFSSFSDITHEDIMLTGVSSQIEKYTAEIKANPDGDHIALGNKAFGSYVNISEDGTIEFKTQNVKAKKAIASALYAAIQPSLEKDRLATLRDLKSEIASDRNIQDAYVVAYNTEIAELDKQYRDQIEDNPAMKAEYEAKKAAVEKEYQTNIAQNASNTEIDKHVVSKEASKTNPYTTWSRGAKRKPGSKQAYGRYQFIKSTAQQAWDLAGIKGTMVHGTQTPAQQDKMWTAHRENIKEHLTSKRIPISPDNVYALHQLGKAGGTRLLLGKNPTEDDLRNMLNNLGRDAKAKYNDVMSPANRQMIPLLWQKKFRKNSTSVVNQIVLKAKLNVNDMQADEYIRKGEKKDAAKDVLLATQLSKVLAAGRADGTLDKESQDAMEKKAKELMKNSGITQHAREVYETTTDTYRQVHEDNQAQSVESKTIEQAENSANVAIAADPTINWQETFDNVMTGILGKNVDLVFKKSALHKQAAMLRGELGREARSVKEERDHNIDNPLKAVESAGVTGDMFQPLLDRQDEMTPTEVKRLKYAYTAFHRSEKGIVEASVAAGLTQPMPKIGENTGSGAVYTAKSLTAIKNSKVGQFNRMKQAVIDGNGDAEQAMDMLLKDGRDGIDSKTLDAVTKEYKGMGKNIHAFVEEFTKDPTVFKNPRFRDSLLSQMDRKEQENFYTFEVFTEVEMRNVSEKTDPSEQVDFTSISQTIGSSDAFIALKMTSSSWLTSDAKNAIDGKGFATENYDMAMEKLGSTPMYGERQVVYTGILNKMVKSGLDSYIPKILEGMMLQDDATMSEGIRVQPTKKITQFMNERKAFREDAALFISQVTGQSYAKSQESADMNNVRIEEDLYSPTRQMYMVIMYPDNTSSRIKIDEDMVPMERPDIPVKTYSQLYYGTSRQDAVDGLDRKKVEEAKLVEEKRRKDIEDARL